MKLSVKILLMAAFMPFAAMAQEKTADEFKNEGNEFVRNKNYKAALASFEQAIELWGDSVDQATVYNAADCARRTKQFDTAIKYYQKSVELNYKADFSTYYIADILGDQGKDEEMEAVLVDGFVFRVTQAIFPAVLVDGFAKYKIGKAAGVIKKSLAGYYVKKGAAIYNEGNNILGTSATAKPEEYASITAKAKEKFTEAKPWIEKALEVDATNANALKVMEGLNEQLK